MESYLRFLAAVILFCCFAFSSSAQTIFVSDNPCSAGDCNTKRFEARDIATHFGNHLGTYTFFWYVGDGTWYKYDKKILSLTDDTYIDHTYKQDGTYEFYMEAVPRYEDDLPPARFNYPQDGGPLGNLTITCGQTSNCTSTSLNPLPSLLDVKMNRDLVPGDMVSYLISYSHTCGRETIEPLTGIITATFNADFMLPDADIPSFHFGIPPIDVFIPSANSGMVTATWTFRDLALGETGHIILPMVVNGDMEEDDEIGVDFKIEYSEGGCTKTPEINLTKTVRNSHDPNNLDSDKIFTCKVIDADTVQYTIRFQNFGDAPADSVIIKDLIPEYYYINSINTIYPNGVHEGRKFISGTREVRWKLSGNSLRGTRALHGTTEPGYGDFIHEEHTIDSLVFTIVKDPDYPVLNKCNAIINRAEIIFDCNPSMLTEPHILRFGCLDSTEVINPNDTLIDPNDTLSDPTISSSGISELLQIAPGPDTSCNKCAEISIIESPAVDYLGDQSVQMVIDQSFLHNLSDYEFLWYPSDGLSDINIMEPTAFPQKTTEYFLVASKPDSCLRRIYKKTVNVVCGSLKIIPTVTCLNGVKSIKATVNNPTPHLKWQDCTFGPVFRDSGMDNEIMNLTVVDTMTNCSAVLSVKMLCPFDPPGPRIPWWLVGIAIISLLGLILNYFRRRP